MHGYIFDTMNNLSKYLFLLFSIYWTPFASAQHDSTMHHHHEMPDSSMRSDHEMSSAFSVNLPMSRDGSGTSWQPDANPVMMYMKMFGSGKTSLMAHGNIFIRYTSQDIGKQSDRGGSQFDAPNMLMLMLSHRYKEDIFSVLTMFSLDPVTVGEAGYPLLFQTGESYNGVPLVDKQHPHDLFAELAFNYTHRFTKDFDINTYLGYPGEPAVGPVAFMHRLSAMNNPEAPLGHHWQDATHITFGVGTLGFRYKALKLEGSIFTGREPDENRYNFDKAKFDSYSYRINVNPSKNLALQFSQGFIKSPEALFPEENITRSTASIIHTKTWTHDAFVSSALVWGLNSTHDDNLHSVLLESNLALKGISVYTRYEFVQKNVHELQLFQFEDHEVFNINAFTLGLNKVILTRFKTDFSLGIQGTIDFPDSSLKPIYGSNPISGNIYLKIAPALGGRHEH